MIQKKCSVCGKIFYVKPHRSRVGRGKYCSCKCYYVSKHINGTIEKKCYNCGKKFRIRRCDSNVYCSRKCFLSSIKKTTKTIRCKICGNKFKAKASVIKNGRGKFCSRECFNINKKNKRTKTQCAYCGKTIAIIQSLLKFRMHFCSMKCRRDAGTIYVNCKNCGKKHLIHKCELKKNGHNFCSRKCKGDYYHKNGTKYPIEIRDGASYRAHIVEYRKRRREYGKTHRKERNMSTVAYQRRHPLETKEREKLYYKFKTARVPLVCKKITAVNYAMENGILTKPLLTLIKKGATHEAYRT